jgi:hypothetical protein
MVINVPSRKKKMEMGTASIDQMTPRRPRAQINADR